jgi:sec-independent protein translocase protein TatA
MGSFGPLEIILIFLVVLLIFGAKRIPEIARGIGKGIREFKDATGEISRELEAEGQNRQINQPQSPQQGQPQARQSQQQPQQPSESASAPSSSGDPSASDAPNDTKKAS